MSPSLETRSLPWNKLMGRRKKSVLIEENWDPEIEEWKKIINDPWYGYEEAMKEVKRMENKKRALTEPVPCPHPKTG